MEKGCTQLTAFIFWQRATEQDRNVSRQQFREFDRSTMGKLNSLNIWRHDIEWKKYPSICKTIGKYFCSPFQLLYRVQQKYFFHSELHSENTLLPALQFLLQYLLPRFFRLALQLLSLKLSLLKLKWQTPTAFKQMNSFTTHYIVRYIGRSPFCPISKLSALEISQESLNTTSVHWCLLSYFDQNALSLNNFYENIYGGFINSFHSMFIFIRFTSGNLWYLLFKK